MVVLDRERAAGGVDLESRGGVEKELDGLRHFGFDLVEHHETAQGAREDDPSNDAPNPLAAGAQLGTALRGRGDLVGPGRIARDVVEFGAAREGDDRTGCLAVPHALPFPIDEDRVMRDRLPRPAHVVRAAVPGIVAAVGQQRLASRRQDEGVLVGVTVVE